MVSRSNVRNALSPVWLSFTADTSPLCGPRGYRSWQQTSTLHFGKKETEAQALAHVQGHTRRDRDTQGCCFSKAVAYDVVSQHSWPKRNGRQSRMLTHPCFLPTLTQVQKNKRGLTRWDHGSAVNSETSVTSSPRLACQDAPVGDERGV